MDQVRARRPRHLTVARRGDSVTEETATPARPDAATIFNSTVAGFAIAAAWELGVLDALRARDEVDTDTFCAENDLHPASVRGIVTALAAVDVVRRADTLVRPGPAFADVFRHKAFFHWLTVGSAELFAALPRVARNGNRRGTFYRRDAAAIGLACREINGNCFDPVFDEAMRALDFEVTTAVDLGCGIGERLVQIAERHPGSRGVGIDLAPSALAAARAHVAARGMADRVDFVEADVRTLGPDPRFDGVDLVTCFMMGHDFWPRHECVEVLRRLRRVFPNARRFLLGDTARTTGISDRAKPIFTLGFETAHDAMGVYLPTMREWLDVFADSDWKCDNVRRVEVPVDSAIFELV
jgi:SAM-dependent methyltransferase